jgi:hypothetical protein
VSEQRKFETLALYVDPPTGSDHAVPPTSILRQSSGQVVIKERSKVAQRSGKITKQAGKPHDMKLQYQNGSALVVDRLTLWKAI